MASARAHINHKMLTWARERVNGDSKTLARRVGTKLPTYEQWEEGDKLPTIKQIQKVAKQLGRPVSHFYLNEPPQESEPRFEMRRVFGGSPRADSFEFAKQVQECIRRRETAIGLFERLSEDIPSLPEPFSIDDSAEQVGRQARFDLIEVSNDAQVGWSSDYVALKAWRSALESSGILSFQMSGVELSEARGFAIADRPLPIAVFNSKDSVRGRIFTLMHEFAHILLGASTLHSQGPFSSRDRTERWCNHVAAAVLIPRKDLLTLQQVRHKGEQAMWLASEIEALANRYRASPSAVIRRLDTFDRISRQAFEALRADFDSRRSGPKEVKSDQKGGDFYRNKMTQLGTLLPSLAFRSFYANEISVSDLSSVMGTKVQNLGTFEERVMGSRYAFARE